MKLLIRKSVLSLTLIRIEDEDEYQRYQEVGGVQLTIHSLLVQIIEVNWLNKIEYSRLGLFNLNYHIDKLVIIIKS